VKYHFEARVVEVHIPTKLARALINHRPPSWIIWIVEVWSEFGSGFSGAHRFRMLSLVGSKRLAL